MILVEFLCTEIRKKVEAENRGVQIINDPPDLAHREMRAFGLLGEAEKLRAKKVPPDDGQLPSAGLSVGNRTILIGSLAESAMPSPSTDDLREPILERWREYQRRCAIARSWLSEELSDDLVLFLVGPLGSEADPEWRALAAQIDRNDLVCRKLVWLPPMAESEWSESVAQFFRRTFLAHPWIDDATIIQSPLDAVADVGPMLASWQTILARQPIQRGDVDYDALVAQLIQEFQP
ncbi:MAG: ABC-three component system middle component 1 [Chthoniobacteraceae bacterium]